MIYTLCQNSRIWFSHLLSKWSGVAVRMGSKIVCSRADRYCPKYPKNQKGVGVLVLFNVNVVNVSDPALLTGLIRQFQIN